VFDGFIGAVVGSFEAAGGMVLWVGAVVETAVGERSAQPFVEQQEEQRDLDAFGAEAVGVARAVALEQAVALELAQVVAQLVQAIGALRKLEGRKDSGMDFFGGPAADMRAAVQQDFEQADDAHVMDFDAGIAHGPMVIGKAMGWSSAKST
jgi:GAF domain-containing protein